MSQQEIVGSILEVVDELKHKITDGEYLKICAGLQKLVLKKEDIPISNRSNDILYRPALIDDVFTLSNLSRYHQITIRDSRSEYWMEMSLRRCCLVRTIKGTLCYNHLQMGGKCGVHKKDKFIRLTEAEYRYECQELNRILEEN